VPEPDLEKESMDAIIKAVYRSRKPDYCLRYDAKGTAPAVRAAWEHRVRAPSCTRVCIR
jgi:hypothetical protein